MRLDRVASRELGYITFAASAIDDSRVGFGAEHEQRQRAVEEWLLAVDKDGNPTWPAQSLEPPPLLEQPQQPPSERAVLGAAEAGAGGWGDAPVSEVRVAESPAAQPFLVQRWKFALGHEGLRHRAQLVKGFKADILEFYRQLLLVREYGEGPPPGRAARPSKAVIPPLVLPPACVAGEQATRTRRLSARSSRSTARSWVGGWTWWTASGRRSGPAPFGLVPKAATATARNTATSTGPR